MHLNTPSFQERQASLLAVSYPVGRARVSSSLKVILLAYLIEMSVKRGRREREVYMSLYISSELKHAIDALRGPINRSVFVEFLLWHGLKVLKSRVEKVLKNEQEMSKLLARGKKKPRVKRSI